MFHRARRVSPGREAGLRSPASVVAASGGHRWTPMMLADVSQARRAVWCPVPRCGAKLAEVSADATGSLWRVCRDCGALVRFDLPEGRWTVERGPKRR